MKKALLIGSHVSLKAKDYCIGSVNASLSYGSICLIFLSAKELGLVIVFLRPLGLRLGNVGVDHLLSNGVNLKSDRSHVVL